MNLIDQLKREASKSLKCSLRKRLYTVVGNDKGQPELDYDLRTFDYLHKRKVLFKNNLTYHVHIARQ